MNLRYVDYKRSDEASLTGFEESPRGFHHHHHLVVTTTTTTTVMIVFTCTSGLLDLCPRSYLPPWTLSAYPADSYHILSFYHTLSFSAHPVNLSKFIIWLFVRRLQSQQKKLVKKSHFPPFEQCACAFVGHFFVF